MESKGDGGRSRLGLTLCLVGIFTIALLLILGSVPGLSTAHPVLVRNGGVSDTATPGSVYNTTPCGVFAFLYSGGGLPYYSNFSLMFSKLCQTPQFVSIYDGMGPSGSFGVGWGGTFGAFPNLSFSL